MTFEPIDSNTHDILLAKQQRLKERQSKTPSAAVIALADMQQFPYPVLNIVTGGESVTLIGQINYAETYDPVGLALHYARAGVDAVSFFTDQRVYTHGLEDLLLVSRGVKLPVVYQNYVLDEYHVAEARASGAAALTLYASILEPVMLRRTVSITQRWRMTAMVQVETQEHLHYVEELSPHVVCVGDPYIYDMDRDIALLETLRSQIPSYTQVMLLGSFSSIEHVKRALELKVDAIVVDQPLIDNPSLREELFTLLHRE